MLTREEKKEVVELTINCMIDPINHSGALQKLHEQLLKDTDNGKLYKYRTFDADGYSVKNLAEGTLHCSFATQFNDPFDCQIGMSVQSVMEAAYGKELDSFSRTVERIGEFMFGDENDSELNETETRIVDNLMKQHSKDYLKSMMQRENNHLEEELTVVGLDLVRSCLTDESISRPLRESASKAFRLIDDLSKDQILQCVKNDGSIEDFAIIKGIIDDADEIDLITKLDQTINPEATMETNKLQKVAEEWNQKMLPQILSSVRIGCLCTDPKNRLMWSHYAGNHSGFCIEYDYSEPDKDVVDLLPLPILYSEERPPIPWKATTSEELSKKLLMGFLTKDNVWSYENEWRFIVDAKAPADLKMPRVSCIYLGVAISEENRDKILKVANEKRIPVKQMVLDRGKYDLHAKDIIII